MPTSANASAIKEPLLDIASLARHPRHRQLIEVVTGETQLSSSGYPYICERCFQLFIREVPHLFRDGLAILDWLADLESNLRRMFEIESLARESLDRAIRVVRTIVNTAAITAPSDLWLLRQVLSTHKSLGILDLLLDGEDLEAEAIAHSRGLSRHQLKIDLHFLAARGYLVQQDNAFRIPSDPAIGRTLGQVQVIAEPFRTDLVSAWLAWFRGAQSQALPDLTQWLAFEETGERAQPNWIANYGEMEIGYRLLPPVLALRVLERTPAFEEEKRIAELAPDLPEPLARLFRAAGAIDHVGHVTLLGERVFKRGPGPFGIVGAYHPYMNRLESLLRNEKTDSWVMRGENVAASQDANRKTFSMANDALDAFCLEYPAFEYNIFIEHAVGKGEATRQRFARSGESRIEYFGADLEDAAIDEAIKEQALGRLPTNMRFIRGADIGRPELIVDYLQSIGKDPFGAVMMVGNGFHEVRSQTNSAMLEVFSGYQEAGILLIFTEETGLSDADLLATAWNTYHAGFRYVHEMSGQGLRPSWDSDRMRNIWSWYKCARQAGYRIMSEYTRSTRTIYPYRKGHRKNPSISVTYFCVPANIADPLGIPISLPAD